MLTLYQNVWYLLEKLGHLKKQLRTNIFESALIKDRNCSVD